MRDSVYQLRIELEGVPAFTERVRLPHNAEDDIVNFLYYDWLEGNNACDCNRRLSIARAAHKPEPPDNQNPCGDTIKLVRLTLLRNDRSERQIHP